MGRLEGATGSDDLPQLIVKTRYRPFLIEKEIVTSIFGKERGDALWQGAIDLQEASIRVALIQLGWTPPPTKG
ncbi:MAG: hypothetical protein V4696_03840 [Pseudomonadota bacterium]